MGRISAAGLSIFAAIGLLTASPANAVERVPLGSGNWTHEASNTTFPVRLGNAERIDVATFFDEERRDVGLNYQMENGEGRLRLTIYIFPTNPRQNCLQRFAGERSTITSRYSGSRLMDVGLADSPDSKTTESALSAVYGLPADSMEQDSAELISQLYLYCAPGGRWLVKLRASWSGTAESYPDVMSMMNAVIWPEELS